MGRYTEEDNGTPCPVRSTRAMNYYASQFEDDTTDDLDFTREIIPDVLHYKSLGELKKKGLKQPPRRITNYVPPVRAERQEQAAQKDRKPSVQEPEIGVEIKSVEPEKKPLRLQQQPRRTTAVVGRRRVSAILKARQQEINAQNENLNRQDNREDEQNFPPAAKRAFGGKRSENVQVQIHFKGSPTEKKQLHAPPKRVPLQAAPKPSHRSTAVGTVRERNSGKENLPPGEGMPNKRVKTSQAVPTRRSARVSGGDVQKENLSLNIPRKSNEVRPKPPKAPVTKPAQRLSRKRVSDSYDETSFTSESNLTSGSLRLIKRQRTLSDSLPSPPSLTAEEEAELVPPADFLIPGIVVQKPIRRSGGRRLDPVLRDDLARCEMYEESWLSAQESSVTQLLNQLLSDYSPAPVGKPRLSLRRDFLKMYSSAPFPLVYNRVHASLLYGALSITSNLIDKSSSRLSRAASNTLGNLSWGNDVGLKSKYLELLIGSYEQSVLITGLEVVVGREMFAFADPSDSEKKTLEDYIERYIIKSEDILATIPTEGIQKKRKGVHIDGGDEDRGTPAWLLRRTLLRSFMLILLLDKAKTNGIMGKQCLFKKNSTHKSSSSLLSALSRLLLPSMGEVSKPLSHLNYALTAAQTPLTEYFYTIDNIAIDIRDGVRLARVVEVLLNSKRRKTYSSEDFAEPEEDWPLTPHLQYPAPSRAQKLHNVTLVLSALGRVQGNPNRVEAKDIVDGHREKTVGLLWSLLSRWGLGLLVDWVSVNSEIRRFESKLYPGLNEEHDVNQPKKDHKTLLKDWAHCVGAKHSLDVSNLTTSFADGRVFEAIVNEYQKYLPSLAKARNSATLEEKLKGVGCNSYFASLFEAQFRDGRVFNEEFVIAGLAYLCSRLLQPAIVERAAITIQRSYRKSVLRDTVHRRINLLLMAHDCAEVVNTRNRVLNAALTIQRAYRAYLHVKIDTLIRRVTSIQSFGRAYLARQYLAQSQSAAILIQRRWREIREARFRSRIGIATHAVIGFQAMVRGALARQKLRNLKWAIAFTQNRWYDINCAFQLRVDFLEMKFASIIIQRLYRRYRDTRVDRARFIEAQKSIWNAQSIAKGFLARSHYNNMISSAIFIQRWHRQLAEMRVAMIDFLKIKCAAMMVQQRRRETVRARIVRMQFLQLKSAVRAVEVRYLEKKKIEKAARILQNAWRKHDWIVRMRRVLREVLLIQSTWRGYLERKYSNPRLRVIRKRLEKITAKGVQAEDTLGSRTKKCLGLLSTKAGFARGIQQLETFTGASIECVQILAKDEAGVSTILSFMETSAQQIQKASTSMTARSLASATNVMSKIANSPKASALVGSRPLTKASKDIFATMLSVIETLKTAPTGTPQHQILNSTMSMLLKLAEVPAVKKRVVLRKKWVEKLQSVLKDIQNGGGKRRRGGSDDKVKAELTAELVEIFS